MNYIKLGNLTELSFFSFFFFLVSNSVSLIKPLIYLFSIVTLLAFYSFVNCVTRSGFLKKAILNNTPSVT